MKKKIIFILPCLLCIMAFANAQYSNGSAATSSKSEPTVNGKPYSQYKAEQDALKRQKEANKVAVQQEAGIVTVNPASAKPAPSKAQPAQPKFENDGYSKPVPAVTEQAVVSNKTEAPKPAPEVPAQFRLPADVSWGNATATEAPVRNAPPASQQVKDNPAQSITAIKTEAYKTPVTNELNKPSGDDQGKQPDMKPVTTPASIVAADAKKAAPAPEVPAQFRLPAESSWGNAAATEMPANKVVTQPQIKDNQAQSVNAQVVAEAYKTPAMKDGNRISGDEGKKLEMKPAPVVDAKLVDAAPKKDAQAILGGQLPGMGSVNAPAAKQQAASIAGTSADGNAVTAEKPVNFKPAPEAVAPATEKPAGRSAAEVEAAKAAQQQADDKSKKPVEASKAAVQDVKVAQQETASAPKKD